MTLAELRDNILKLVAEGELDAALTLLLREVDKESNCYKLVINLQSRLANARQDLITGAVGQDKIQETKNSIRAGILELRDILHPGDMAGAHISYGSSFIPSNAPVPVFFSRGTPFSDEQKRFQDVFVEQFNQHGIQLETPMWSAENPLLPVRQKMKEVGGCVVLALERMQSIESVYKKGSPKEEKFLQEYFPTPWIQMEAAMAYQGELPLLIFSDTKLRSEGMIELGVHEFRIFKVNTEHPEELQEEYYANLIRSWSEKVRQFYRTRFEK